MRNKNMGSVAQASKVMCFALLVIAITLLIGARAPTSFELFGLSGTAWFTLAPIVIGGAYWILHLRNRTLPENIQKEAQKIPVFLAVLVFVIGAYLTVLFVLRPNWEGAQALAAYLSFSLILLTARHLRENLLTPRAQMIVLFSLWACASLLISSFFSIEVLDWAFFGRDRGEVLLISIAIVPLLTRSMPIGMATVACLSIATLLSDSRLATGLLPVLVPIVFTALSRHHSGKSRLIIAAGLGLLSFGAIATFQRLLGLRESFPFLSQEVATEITSIVDLTPPEVNAWSFGRTEVWGHLANEIKNLQDTIWGKGLGHSATIGRELNPSFHHPHNEYLRFLVDSGAIGFSLLLALFIQITRMYLSNIRRSRTTAEIVGLSLVLVLSVNAFFSNPLLTPHFFVPLAFFLGWTLKESEPTSENPYGAGRANS